MRKPEKNYGQEMKMMWEMWRLAKLNRGRCTKTIQLNSLKIILYIRNTLFNENNNREINTFLQQLKSWDWVRNPNICMCLKLIETLI